MQVQSISSAKFENSRNLAFGDGEVADNFGPREAMERLRKKGYVLSGNNNQDAFEKLYDQIDNTYEGLVRDKKAVYYEKYTPSVFGKEPDFLIMKSKVQKNEFATVLTKFWDKVRGTKINDVDVAVRDFLVNTQGMEKPNFFQRFSSCFAKYIDLETILESVTQNFIKTGQHSLK